MPRARAPGGGRRSVYWWSTKIADLRAVSLRARRQYTKARRWDRRWITEGPASGAPLRRVPRRTRSSVGPSPGLKPVRVTSSSRPSTKTLGGARTGPCPSNSDPGAPPVTEGPGTPASPRRPVSAVSPSPCSRGGWRRRVGRPGVDVGH